MINVVDHQRRCLPRCWRRWFLCLCPRWRLLICCGFVALIKIFWDMVASWFSKKWVEHKKSCTLLFLQPGPTIVGCCKEVSEQECSKRNTKRGDNKATYRYEKPCVLHDGVVEFIFDSISGLSSSDFFYIWRWALHWWAKERFVAASQEHWGILSQWWTLDRFWSNFSVFRDERCIVAWN